jgi:hypothetical protein
METEIVTTAASPVLFYPDVVVESPWFDFFQGIVASIAWPAVVVLAIWLFHKQLLAMIPQIDGVKVAGAEVSFKNRVEAVVEQAKEIDAPDEDVAQENNDRLAHLINMAATSPTGAIIAAWKDLEAASRDLIALVTPMMQLELLPDSAFQKSKSLEELLRSTSGVVVGRRLLSMGLLPAAEAKTFDELRKLRNRATHEPEGAISVEEARSYVKVADKLTDLIRTNVRNINAADPNRPQG